MSAGDAALRPDSQPQPSAGLRGDLLRRLSHWRLMLLDMRETQLFLLLAILIGILSGLSVVCFRIAIDWLRIVLLGSALSPPPWRLLVVPAAVGLLVASLLRYAFPRAGGSGVNQTKAALYIFDGYIPFRTVIGKFLTCALAIGSGQSLGPEDPSLQMSAGIASLLGRRLRLSREKVRLIAPIGAAAGLAAAFNAPITAVLFVIEEIIGNWSGGVLGAIILAAVSSVVTMRWFLGDQPLFRIPSFRFQNPAELFAYAVLGIVGGLLSLVFLKFVLYLRPRLQSLPRWTHLFQPAAAGLTLGVIGIWLPQVLGAGYPAIDQVLHDEFTWRILLILALMKIFATTISLCSGSPGGVFAPTLFIGAMIGGAVGGIEQHYFHALHGSVAAFALVGMGTLFAGFLRTPITSVFMIVAITGNYSIILPVMISNMLAYLISRRFQKTPLFDVLSRQDGMVLPSLEEMREQSQLRVEDAMQVHGVPILRPAEKIGDVSGRIPSSAGDFCLVSGLAGTWHLVSAGALRHKLAENPDALVRELQTAVPLPFVYPDQTLEEVLRQMQDWPFLPVLSRVNSSRLEGTIAMKDILNAYRQVSGAPEH